MVSWFCSGSKSFLICWTLVSTWYMLITESVTMIDSLQYQSVDCLFLNWAHLAQYPLLCRVWAGVRDIERATLHTCPSCGSDTLIMLCILLFGIQAKLMEGNRTKQRALSWRDSTHALYIDIWDQEPVFSSIEVSQLLILNKGKDGLN